MESQLKKWKRQKPENETGDYYFNGRCVATRGVSAKVPEEELKAIVQDVHNLAFESGGIDYLQTYKNEETGLKIWVIDQVTKSSLEDGSQPAEHNYYTILLPSEY